MAADKMTYVIHYYDKKHKRITFTSVEKSNDLDALRYVDVNFRSLCIMCKNPVYYVKVYNIDKPKLYIRSGKADWYHNNCKVYCPWGYK